MSRSNPEHLSPRGSVAFLKGNVQAAKATSLAGVGWYPHPPQLFLSLKLHTLQTSTSVLRANSGCISMQTALQYKVLPSSDSRQDKRETDGFILGTAKDFFLPLKNLTLSTGTKLVENEALL